jgi:hypothetical protein
VDYTQRKNQLAGWSFPQYVDFGYKTMGSPHQRIEKQRLTLSPQPSNQFEFASVSPLNIYPGRLITQYTTRLLTISWLRNQLRPKRSATQSDAFASGCPYWSIVLWLSLSISLAINQHSHWYASTGVQLTPRDWQDAFIVPEGAMSTSLIYGIHWNCRVR